ncbi:Crp/Fnr family transcriptional regulator [Novosphingobium album (ex Hu et al. 2023)]|uniref:Crp/Fnr family transcriptional regulator n=1 Tax=Novosphingobium album (ex Hu et al. 2023) TaxID=2930093 RepID=A0ABT0AWP5_9SPHN|nr:Crp/Fnr family transcriptional regulator [Novosphingobium album (ex Hu et al. 2023)]MCJ2177185.1 Crp/Fnr family transcriptional regulator [Novosphingobium album (ex Hu et al. 2023)]
MLDAERLAVMQSVFSCSDDAAAALGAAVRELSVPAKGVVARQGDLAHHCWLVVDGVAQAQINGPDGQLILLASYGPGELFGSYPGPAALRTDFVAMGALTLFSIKTTVLADLARSNADVGHGLSVLLARQLDTLLDRMAARTTLSATGRVYAELLRLAGDSNRIEPPPVLSALALTVHTTRETASRAIANLVRRGIVRRTDAVLEITAPRLLAELIA